MSSSSSLALPLVFRDGAADYLVPTVPVLSELSETIEEGQIVDAYACLEVKM